MNFIIYIIVYPFIWILSILPFRLLYFFSDIVFLLLYYVVGYRKKLVYNNLKLVFPKKSNSEILEIRKNFYRHFTDIFVEMIKFFTISEKEIDKRYRYTNLDLFKKLQPDGKNIMLVGAHYANWEWILSLPKEIPYKGYGAYTPINNPYFNRRVIQSRKKFGAHLVATKQLLQTIEENNKNNVQSLYGLLSDQSPSLRKTFYWSNFLGVKVPVHTGAEMIAKKYNMNVVFINTKKIKRGYYETTFELLTNNATVFTDYKLTDLFLQKAENQIYTTPQFYFWTHNRFKHKDKVPK